MKINPVKKKADGIVIPKNTSEMLTNIHATVSLAQTTVKTKSRRQGDQ